MDATDMSGTAEQARAAVARCFRPAQALAPVIAMYDCFYLAYIAVTYESERADAARESLSATLPQAIALVRSDTPESRSDYRSWMCAHLSQIRDLVGGDVAAGLLAGPPPHRRSPCELWSGIAICVCGSIADGFRSGPGELYNLWVEAGVNLFDVPRNDPALYSWLDAVRSDWDYPDLRPLIVDELPAEAAGFLRLELGRAGFLQD